VATVASAAWLVQGNGGLLIGAVIALILDVYKKVASRPDLHRSQFFFGQFFVVACTDEGESSIPPPGLFIPAHASRKSHPNGLNNHP
jgi:hypothetical protein